MVVFELVLLLAIVVPLLAFEFGEFIATKCCCSSSSTAHCWCSWLNWVSLLASCCSGSFTNNLSSNKVATCRSETTDGSLRAGANDCGGTLVLAGESVGLLC